MSVGLKRSRLKEPGRGPGHPQPQPHHVQVFMPPPRLLAFPEIVMKRSLVFAQIVSPHGKTSPGWFTLAFIVLLGSTSDCTELRTSVSAQCGRTPVAITSSHIPRSPPEDKEPTQPRSNLFLGRRHMQANRRPSRSSSRTLTERQAGVFHIHGRSAGSCGTDSDIIDAIGFTSRRSAS